MRPWLTALGLVALLAGVSALPELAWSEDEPPPTAPAMPQVVYVELLHEGKTAKQWARAAARERSWRIKRGRIIRQQRRDLERRYAPTIEHYFSIAAIAYGVDRATLERKGRCESGNFTDFVNESSDARGVMQFLLSTWRTTPFARFDRLDHLANIMAGAYMHSVGRGAEWVCQ